MYRFDNAYKNIYKYDKSTRAYLFLTSYYMADIKKSDSLKTKERKIREYEEQKEDIRGKK